MRRVILGALALAVSTLPAQAAESFKVDKNHSDASFEIRHLMSKVRGRFTDVAGSIQIDRAKPEASSVEFTIQSASIDTANDSRDEHLRSADFFDAATHPTITFKSSKVTPRGKDAYDVAGTLTMRGVSKDVVLPVTVLGFQKDPGGNERVGFETTTVLNRKDFNILWNKNLDAGGVLLGDEVTVRVNVEGVAPRQAASN